MICYKVSIIGKQDNKILVNSAELYSSLANAVDYFFQKLGRAVQLFQGDKSKIIQQGLFVDKEFNTPQELFDSITSNKAGTPYVAQSFSYLNELTNTVVECSLIVLDLNESSLELQYLDMSFIARQECLDFVDDYSVSNNADTLTATDAARDIFNLPKRNVVEVLDPNVMLDIAGKGYHCTCGSNVFSKIKRNGLILYKCHGCGALYEGEQ